MYRTKTNKLTYILTALFTALLMTLTLCSATQLRAAKAEGGSITTTYTWTTTTDTPESNTDWDVIAVGDNLSGRTLYLSPGEIADRTMVGYNDLAKTFLDDYYSDTLDNIPTFELTIVISTSTGKSFTIGAKNTDSVKIEPIESMQYVAISLPEDFGVVVNLQFKITATYDFVISSGCWSYCTTCETTIDCGCSPDIYYDVDYHNVYFNYSDYVIDELNMYIDSTEEPATVDYQSQINALQSQNSQLTADKASLQAQITEKNDTIQENNTEIAALQSQITALQSQINEGGSDNPNIEELQRQLDEATAKWNDLINSNQQAVEARDKLNDKLADINDRYGVNVGKLTVLDELYELGQNPPTTGDLVGGANDLADKINEKTGLALTGTMLLIGAAFIVIKLIFKKR